MPNARTGIGGPFFVPFGNEPPQAIKPSEDYFVVQIHAAQAAFRGSIWERVKSLIIASQVNLNHPAFPDGGVRAIQRAREVRRGRAEQLGLNTNLVNLVPAIMPNVSISIDFILDKESRLSALAGLINSDAFLAAVSMAPVGAKVAKTVSSLTEKILNTFIPAQEREPILQFAGDFNLAGEHVDEGYYVVLGTRDEEAPLPEPGARFQVVDGGLRINGSPADAYSYVIMAIKRIAARGRALNGGAAWDQRLREAEDEARNALQDPLADKGRREEVWKKCVTLIKEAQVLLRTDPNYHRSEADQIVRATLLQCQPLVAVTEVVSRGFGRGATTSDRAPAAFAEVAAHLAFLGVAPNEDLGQSARAYQARLGATSDTLTDLAKTGAVK
jgi:hypothetical protein